MKITPKSPEEIAGRLLISKGTYSCRICYGWDDRSQFDSEMIVLTVEVITRDGEVIGKLIDRITEKLEGGQKLRNFCEAFGLLDRYNAGHLTAKDCVSRSARCEVIIKRSVKYGTRNEIKRYFAGPVLASSKDGVTGDAA